MWRHFLFFLLLPSTPLWADHFSLTQIADRFPSEGFEDQIQFWRAMFTRYGEREVVFHDRNDVRLIYEVVRFDRGVSEPGPEQERQSRRLREKKKELEKRLSRLQELFANPPRNGMELQELDPAQRGILELLHSRGYSPSSALFQRLKDNVRHQRGIREKFHQSIIRSGMYLDAMQKIFAEQGLPAELAFLAHVESSFDHAARSSAGAAGIWQLMRGTSRHLLTIGRSVDERLDPLRATEAAARLLKENYEELGNWPLAITAYNHGKNGIKRARNLHGPELRKIIDNYESRIFGFAGKNFYAEFLAAVEISRNSYAYFGPLKPSEPMRYDSLRLRKAYRVEHFAHLAQLTPAELRNYNPHLTHYVWTRSQLLPAGVEIRVPAGKGSEIASALQPIAARTVAVSGAGSARYQVRLGDTLTKIAARFGTSVEALMRANQIRDPHHIQVGQILTIP